MIQKSSDMKFSKFQEYWYSNENARKRHLTSYKIAWMSWHLNGKDQINKCPHFPL